MSLLRPSITQDIDQRLEGQGVYLRHPVMADYKAWSDLRSQSREFLKPWEPIWPKDDLTKAGFRRRLRRYARDRRDGKSHSFLLFKSETDDLLGGLTLSNIRRGVSQSVTLGYWMGVSFAGRGFMSKAVELIQPFCFEALGLHRIEAACLPHNAPSLRLLEKAGFVREGYARNYLLINGYWQDHLLLACLAEDHAAGKNPAPMTIGGNLKEFL
ncbi:[SSU ribosomal protein S5P]-alanine acetyltransferase [Roseibium hamelinense]|uniref:[SSU ribosomal protein S5P]-alanine acetyltransferase n=1 Tax=Roseibium hamelinense TaxID=150831 RepID=A0A562T1Q9_9HYPH|nr:GNAT family protein [Roseibium hamelinense]MTI42937.1 N-acetyltransferase [Roseibium hamelinense]TWI87627.1 [SSU ribosomal protein S5P]-alanine acetyltransferase [Roseibium hamelinense]